MLTPTEIAKELGLFYKTGNPNAQAVNKLLEKLGYQVRVGKQWSATEKATKLGLSDRKPVETNSRSQKDQMLWSSKIIPILKEYILK
nr:phage antirepressor KilAC domain-containing protein [Merismopedia glauca]